MTAHGNLPGQRVSDRWAQWRAGTDLDEYESRWNRLEAEGHATHGEADLICSLNPRRVLDAGCGMGRVAIELDRRGISAAGADLDDDLLEVARRHAPHISWILADLATDGLDDHYDVVVMAGNVMIFCRAEDRAPIVSNLAAHLEPGGHLIAGFALEPTIGALTLPEYETACAAAGLEIVQRLATWEGDPFPESPDLADQGYAVVVARSPINPP
jgi:SAM-dependent methyltransferase